MRVLVLYEELAGYFLNALNLLASSRQATVLVISKKINAVAPFDFETHPNVSVLNREMLSAEALMTTCIGFNPDAIYLGGWAYKPYLAIIRRFKKIKTVIGFDNQHNGSVRQLAGALYFKWRLKPYVYGAFVPGDRQARFAKQLGFSNNQVATGAYCCDLNLFDTYYQRNKEKKERQFPKRFLFAGRYASEKGIQHLWQTFVKLHETVGGDWELWCIGKGDMAPVQHPAIKHLGFVQPQQLGDIIQETGVFVLPSLFEPWGVVIQEYAAAGFPIITTDAVGAADAFVINGKNGYLIRPNDIGALEKAMRQMMEANQLQLTTMAQQSNRLSKTITPESWVNNLLKLYEYP
jgi:glycosyltransferase involved in cell wall biosynthesis